MWSDSLSVIFGVFPFRPLHHFDDRSKKRRKRKKNQTETFQQIQIHLYSSLCSEPVFHLWKYCCVCVSVFICVDSIKCDLTSNSTSNYRSVTDEVNLYHKLAPFTDKFMMTKTPFKRISIVLFLASKYSSLQKMCVCCQKSVYCIHTIPKSILP